MNRSYATILLLAIAESVGAAQRPDGCPVGDEPLFSLSSVSREAADRSLKDAGVALTVEALTFALGDARAYVRSLAAARLAGSGAGASGISSLLQAWVTEKDMCTKFLMTGALGSLLRSRAEDPKQRPGGQEWITPFQQCSASEHSPVTLLMQNAAKTGTTVEVYARNNSEQILPFLGAAPQRLFSATVFGPGGAPAKIAKGREEMYKPLLMTSAPVLIVLQPHEDTHLWTWDVGADFDLSAPGTYRVSLGGRIGFLDATLCSNAVDVIVPM